MAYCHQRVARFQPTGQNTRPHTGHPAAQPQHAKPNRSAATAAPCRTAGPPRLRQHHGGAGDSGDLGHRLEVDTPRPAHCVRHRVRRDGAHLAHPSTPVNPLTGDGCVCEWGGIN